MVQFKKLAAVLCLAVVGSATCTVLAAGGGRGARAAGDAGAAAAPPAGPLKLVVGGSLKLKLQKGVTPVIKVPDDTGPEKSGYRVAVDLRSDQATMLTVCPEPNTKAYPRMKLSTPGEQFPLEAAQGNGGYEVYGEYLKHTPKVSQTVFLTIYTGTAEMSDTGGDITLRAVVNGDLRCPGPHQ